MDRERLTTLLSAPGEVARQDIQDLQDLAQRFPWFSGARLLLAVGEDKAGNVLSNDRATAAAAHLPSRAVLFDLTRTDSPRPQAPMHVVRDAADLDVVNLLEPQDRHPASTVFPATDLAPVPTVPETWSPTPTMEPAVHRHLPPPAAIMPPPAGPTSGPDLRVTAGPLPTTAPAVPEPVDLPPAPAVKPVVEQAPDPLDLLYREAAASAPYDLGRAIPITARTGAGMQQTHATPGQAHEEAHLDPLAYLYRETEAATLPALAAPVAIAPVPPPPPLPATPLPTVAHHQPTVPEPEHAPAAPLQVLPEHARYSFSTWLDMSLGTTPFPSVGPAETSAPATPAGQTETAPDRASRSIRPGVEELPSTEEILERFIQRPEPGIPPQKTAFFTPQLAAKRSLQDEGLVSETLGKIHEAQGNHAKAMEVYARLAQLHPEKSVYFAALLKALEGRMNK